MYGYKLVERCGRGDPGIRHEDVEPAEGQRRLAEEGDDSPLVGHVDGDRRDAVATMALYQCSLSLAQRAPVDVADHDAGAFAE